MFKYFWVIASNHNDRSTRNNLVTKTELDLLCYSTYECDSELHPTLAYICICSCQGISHHSSRGTCIELQQKFTVRNYNIAQITTIIPSYSTLHEEIHNIFLFTSLSSPLPFLFSNSTNRKQRGQHIAASQGNEHIICFILRQLHYCNTYFHRNCLRQIELLFFQGGEINLNMGGFAFPSAVNVTCTFRLAAPLSIGLAS